MTDPTPHTEVATLVTDPREAWLLKRKSVITGTDLAALFGVDRYGKTPMKVWLDKTGREPAMDDTPALRFGRRFERPILEEYAEQEKVELSYPGVHALKIALAHPFLGATLDAQHVTDGTPVDAKNMGFRSPEFGSNRSDMVPLAYALQLTAQMIVTGTQAAALAVLFNRYEFNTFFVALDPIVVERVLERAERFMIDHVQADTPPPVDGSESWSTWLGSHLKQRDKRILQATPEQHEFAVALHVTKQHAEALKEEQERLTNHLKLAIGDAYGMEGPEWRITWSQSKDGVKIDWAAAFMELAKIAGNPAVDKATIDGIVATFTTAKPGTRVFRLTFKEESAG